MRLKHRSCRISQAEVRVSHNGCRHERRDAWVRCLLSSNAIKELSLSDWLQGLRTVCAIPSAVFHANRRSDIVSGAGILDKLFEEIAVVGSLPQVMMRVTDK